MRDRFTGFRIMFGFGIPTAIISPLIGTLSSLLPTLIKEWTDTRAANRDLAMQEKMHEWQLESLKAQAEFKLDIQAGNASIEEIHAANNEMMAAMSQFATPTGWSISDFMASLVRPMALLGIMGLFFWISHDYCQIAFDAYKAKKLTIDQLSGAIFGSLIGESIEAFLGFLLGYHATKKVTGA
jgi:hypothetical protein